MTGRALFLSAAATFRYAERVLKLLVAALLFSLLWLIFVDVFGRYFFASPIPFSNDLLRVGLVAVVFSALPLVSAYEEHVRLGIVFRLLRRKTASFYHAIVSVMCAAACAVLAIRVSSLGNSMLRDGAQTAYLKLPLGVVAFGISAMLFATAVVHVAIAVRHTLVPDQGEARTGDPRQ